MKQSMKWIMMMLSVSCLNAAAQGNIQIREDGQIKLPGNIMIMMQHFAPGWKCCTQNQESIKMSPGNSQTYLKGVFTVKNGKFNFVEKINIINQSSLVCSWSVSASGAIKTKSLSTILELPFNRYKNHNILIDGKPVKLTVDRKTRMIVVNKPFRTIEFPGADKKIILSSGSKPGRYSIYSHSGRSYQIRVHFDSFRNNITKAALQFSIKIVDFQSTPVNLSKVANKSFTDEDGKGGWTDQGSSKDLRALKPGKLVPYGIAFDILDAQKNNGKSCIILKGGERQYYPGSAKIDITANKTYRNLYLLHATAWTGGKGRNAGTIKAVYTDGSTSIFNVQVGREVNDWTSGNFADNGAVAWSGHSPAFNKVFLFMSRFTLANKPLRSLKFLSGKPVWMICAASLSSDILSPITKAKAIRKIYRADHDWIAIDWNPVKIVKNSPLDFSIFTDAPAGKYGEVIIKNDKFYFANASDKAVRFFGTNLTHQSPFGDKEYSETIANKLAAEGFNAVRLHLNERYLTASDGATKFNPVQKDKLDYLISCLKRKGIYYVMIIYSGAFFKPGAIKDVPEFRNRKFRFEIKAMAMYSEDAMNYMKRYAKALLCSVNPYTKMAPKDDPALIGVELTNENPSNNWKREYPEFTPIFTKLCQEYLTKQRGHAPTSEEVQAYYYRYLLILQSRFYQRMKTYLRQDLGVMKPLSDINCRSSLGFAMVRNEFDYVDVHAYWELYRYVGSDSGGGMWTKGKKYKAYRLKYRSPITDRWSILQKAAAARLISKPFACGEFNMCYPAPERAMTVPLQSALAGLQGWSMILHYAYSSRPWAIVKPHREELLQLANSPLVLFSDRIGKMLFAANEIVQSKIIIPLVITPEYIYKKLETQNRISPPYDYYMLGLSCGIGTIIADDSTDLSNYPCVVIPKDMQQIPACVRKVKYFRTDNQLMKKLKNILPGTGKNKTVSTTGQIDFDSGHGRVVISTPRSECLLLDKQTKNATGQFMTVNDNQLSSVCFAGSLDNLPLKQSRRILLLYLTDLKNTDTIVKMENTPVIEEKGKLPHLVRQGKIKVGLKNQNRNVPQVWALKYDGSRKSEVKVTKSSDGFAFPVQAVTAKDAYFAYEIVWK